MDTAKSIFNDLAQLAKGYENYLQALLVLIIAILINRFLRLFLNNYFNDSSKELRVDKTRYLFLKNATSLIVFSIAAGLIIYTIPSLHSLSLTLFASAGIFAAILGFASQQAFSNIIGGIFIVIFKPFRVGDWINISDKYSGIVEDITLRHVVINNFENKRIIIPNSIISSETIINLNINDNRVCEFCEYTISLDSNVDKAIVLIQEEAGKHPSLLDARTDQERENNDPLVVVRMTKWVENGVVLRAYIWSRDPIEGVMMKYDLNRSVKKRFDQEPDIEIPYPHRTVTIKNQSEQL